jgi:hypothetical protein
MTEHRALATEKNRCHPSSLNGQGSMPNCVDALTKPMQTAPPQTSLDRPGPEAYLKQLPPTNNPMLATGKLPNQPISRRRRLPTSTRPTFSFYAIGNVGLVGHGADVGRGGRAGGAPNFNSLQRK